jgi:O-antigen/teichoic acid export membrane protein
VIKFFIKNSIILTFVEFVVRAKSLIVISLMTFYLGPEKFGTWSQVVAISAFFTPFILMGNDAAIFRFLPGSEKPSQFSFFHTWLISSLVACFFVAFFLSLFSNELSIYMLGGINNAKYILLVPLILISNTLVNSVKIWFRSLNEIKHYGGFIVILALASLSISYILIFFQFSFFQIILYLSLLDIFTSIIIIIWIYRDQVFFTLPNISVLIKLLRFGAPLFFSSFAMWGLNYVDRFLLPNYVSIKDVGIYTLAYQLGSMASQALTTPIWTQFQAIVTSDFNNGDISRYKRNFNFIITGLLVLSVPLVVGLFAIGKSIILMFAPSEFLNGVYVMPLIALGYVFHILASCYEVVIGLYHKQKILSYTSLFIFLLNFFSNLILIPFFGIMGAAIASLLSFFVQFVLAFYLAQQYRLGSPDIKVFIKILFASLFMGFGVFFFKALVPVNSFGTVLQIFFGILIYFIMILSFRVSPLYSLKNIRLRFK